MSKESEAKVGVTGDTTQFVRAMGKAEASLHMFGSMLSNMGGIMGSVGSIVQGFAGAGVMGGLIAALNEVTEALGAALDQYMEFETALVDTASASGLTGDALAQLTQEIQDAAMAAGVDFGVGATEATRAMESLVKAGMEGQDAITALNAALALAVVEGMNTAEASDQLVGILNMYSMAAEDAAHATDVLVNASIAGVGTASEFARGLSYVGGRAAQLGFSLEETTAALVALNNQGIEATTAGQSLNMMFTSLIQKSDDLGFSMYDSTGTMLSLAEIMGNLTDKLQSMATQEERNTYLTQIFGARAGRAAAALLNLGDSGDEVAAALMAMTEGMAEGGTAMGIFEQKQDTLAGTQDRLNAIFENMAITVGEALAPIMETLAGIMEETLIPAFEFIMPILQTIFDVVGGLIAFFMDLATVIGNALGPAIEWLSGILKPVADFFGAIAGAIGGFIDAVVTGVSDMADAVTDAADEVSDATDSMQYDFDDIDYDAIDKSLERAGMIPEAWADAADGVEDAVDQINDALNDMRTESERAFDDLVATATSSIEQGLLGEAQDAIQDFVDCSLNKQAEMVEDIDGYLADMSEKYKENAAKINQLLAEGKFEEANMLQRANDEIMAKMEQLMAWRTQLLEQSWDSTSEAVRQSLMDQYGLFEQYYGDIEELMPEPPDLEPIIEPIERIIDPIRSFDPIHHTTPEPISPTLANVNMEFTGDYTPEDARELAERVYNEIEKIQEEKMRARWHTRFG